MGRKLCCLALVAGMVAGRGGLRNGMSPGPQLPGGWRSWWSETSPSPGPLYLTHWGNTIPNMVKKNCDVKKPRRQTVRPLGSKPAGEPGRRRGYIHICMPEQSIGCEAEYKAGLQMQSQNKTGGDIMQPHLACGIDVSSRKLEVCVLPLEGKPLRYVVQNTVEGISRLISWLRGMGVKRVVMEATGGYEREARVRFRRAGFEVYVANPRQVRDYARGIGRRAKTDKIDAEVIARFASVVGQRDDREPTEVERQVQELHKRLCQLKEMYQSERNRRRFAGGLVQESIDRHLGQLRGEIERVERELRALVEGDDEMRGKVGMLTRHKGVGFLTAVGLMATLPELGKVSRKEIAALAGVAPFTRESGRWKGRSFISGGRRWARRYLYMAALVASRYNERLREFYERLIARGKAKKLALVAVMRKLLVYCNATLRYA